MRKRFILLKFLFFFLFVVVPSLIYSSPEGELEKVVSHLTDYTRYDQTHTPQQLERWQSQIRKYFPKHLLSDITDLIRLLEERIGKEAVQDRLVRSISIFQKLKLERLRSLIPVYEEYLGREGVNDRLRRSLTGFVETTDERLKGVIEIIEGYIGKDGVAERMRADLQGFFRNSAERLSAVLNGISSYLSKNHIQQLLKRYLREFGSQSAFERLKDIRFPPEMGRDKVFQEIADILKEIRSGSENEDGNRPTLTEATDTLVECTRDLDPRVYSDELIEEITKELLREYGQRETLSLEDFQRWVRERVYQGDMSGERFSESVRDIWQRSEGRWTLAELKPLMEILLRECARQSRHMR